MCHIHYCKGHTYKQFKVIQRVSAELCKCSQTQSRSKGREPRTHHNMIKLIKDSDSHHYQSLESNFYRRGGSHLLVSENLRQQALGSTRRHAIDAVVAAHDVCSLSLLDARLKRWHVPVSDTQKQMLGWTHTHRKNLNWKRQWKRCDKLRFGQWKPLICYKETKKMLD